MLDHIFSESYLPFPFLSSMNSIMNWRRPGLASYQLFAFIISFTNAKFVYILLILFCVNMCINVSPSPSTMKSEPLVKYFQMGKMNILTLMLLCLCTFAFILSKVDLNIRYIPFNTRLNTLTASKKTRSNGNLYFYSLLLLYVTTFEYVFIVFLPYEFCKINLDIRKITHKSVIFVKMLRNLFTSITLLCATVFRILFFTA